MFRFYLAVIVLFVSLTVANLNGQPTQPPTLLVFADLAHTGQLEGPIAAEKDIKGFGIAVPLPSKCIDGSGVLANNHHGEDLVHRLGRIQIEANPVGEISIKITGKDTSALTLFLKSGVNWQRI